MKNCQHYALLPYPVSCKITTKSVSILNHFYMDLVESWEVEKCLIKKMLNEVTIFR